MSRTRSTGRKAGLAALATLAPLLLVEGGFQVYEARRARRRPSIVEDDPLTGYRLKPNLTAAFDSDGVDHPLTTSPAGHRGRALLPAKPPGGFRVACLGGSTTFGFGASAEDRTYPAVLERLLQAAAPGRAVEVLNAGVPGWTLRTGLDEFAARLAPLSFDAVVLYEANNDLYDGWSPAYAARAALSPGQAPPASPLAALARRSAFLRWAARAAGKRALANKRPTFSPDGHAAYRRNLETAVEYFRARGVRLLLCTYPNVMPETQADAERLAFDGPYTLRGMLKRCPLEYGALRDGLIAYNETIRAVARERQVDLVDLDALIPDDPKLYVDTIHHDDDGLRLLAEAVASHALRAGWLTPDARR